jgi:hypothetical protein
MVCTNSSISLLFIFCAVVEYIHKPNMECIKIVSKYTIKLKTCLQHAHYSGLLSGLRGRI